MIVKFLPKEECDSVLVHEAYKMILPSDICKQIKKNGLKSWRQEFDKSILEKDRLYSKIEILLNNSIIVWIIEDLSLQFAECELII